jgi:hypothetical protein
MRFVLFYTFIWRTGYGIEYPPGAAVYTAVLYLFPDYFLIAAGCPLRKPTTVKNKPPGLEDALIFPVLSL